MQPTTLLDNLNSDFLAAFIEDENTYLFIQGHTIKDNVTLMFLKSVFSHLKSEKEKQIKANAKHDIDRNNQLSSYKNQIIPIETTLNSNTEYKSCFLYQKITTDIELYINIFLS